MIKLLYDNMLVVFTLGLLSIFFAWLESSRIYRHGLLISFILIFLFTALRYNFGTDYMGYYQFFNDLKTYSDIFTEDIKGQRIEIGWKILCFAFKPIGFFGMIFVLSAFICYTYYSLIKKYVPLNYYWLAVLIYVFSFDIMLIQFSALRQAVSIAIFLNSVKFLHKRSSPVMYILLILLAATIHYSAIFMIIFVMFAFKKVRKSNYIGYIIFLAFFGLLFFGKYLLNYLPIISAIFTEDRYETRFDTDISSTMTLFGGLFWSLLFTIVLYYSRFQSRNIKYLFYFYSLFFMTYILSNLIFLGDRLGYYFAPFSIIVLPLIVLKVKNTYLELGLIAVFLIFIFNRFFHYFTLDWVSDGYSKYQTIFSDW